MAATTFFITGNPDGKIATASRPDSPSGIEIESADDFTLSGSTTITGATFTGLLTGTASLSNVVSVDVEFYKIFPELSDVSRRIRVPTRVNSPSDNALVTRDSTAGTLSFTGTVLSSSFTASNSVVNGINPVPNQTTGGEGPVTGTEVQFSVNFAQSLNLPQGHFFFVPQVLMNNGQFLWLSAPRPIVSPGTPFSSDLQEWIRNSSLVPDWLRVGTDIVDGASQPSFNGTFSLTGQPLTPGPFPVFDQSFSIVGIGDFNGDGAADIAWQNQTTKLVVTQQLFGTTTISSGPIANSPFDSSFNVVAAGDFNRDTRSDLVYRRSDGLTEIQFLNGNTGAGGGIIPNNPFDSTFRVAGAADFNGDGFSDLLWQRPTDGVTEIQLMTGTTPTGGWIITNNPFDRSFSIMGMGDFNGDGKSDLVWRRGSDGLTEIQFLNANNPTGGGLILNNPFATTFQVAGVGDFNGDGRADIVWHRPDGLTEIQFMNGTTPIGGGIIGNNPFDSTFQVAGVGDFNADGFADLVYRRTSDGLTEIQFLKGNTAIGGGVSSLGSMPLSQLDPSTVAISF